jgi:hypothetical protein
MLADLPGLALWTLFMVASVLVTRHLQWNAGILVASQATVASLAALVDARFAAAGAVSILLALAFASLLGVFHFAVLRAVGPGVLLMLTAVSQLILVEFWYAFPALTGGSGGLLLPSSVSPQLGIALFLCVAVAAGATLRLLGDPQDYRWASIRALGPHAGAVGVPAPTLFVVSFALYGLVLGSIGIAAARTLGFLTAGMFGLPWALAVVMVTLATGVRGGWGIVLLCAGYAIGRVLLRQSVYASPFFSTFFEIAFPVALFAMYLLRESGKDAGSEGGVVGRGLTPSVPTLGEGGL